MFHMTTTTGGEDIPDEWQIQQRQSETCPDVWRILLCGSHLSVPTDLMDRIDTHEISNIPTTRSLPVCLWRQRRPWVPATPSNDSVFPERLYQECLNQVSSVTGCSILHERDIRNLTSLN
ncbi:hypothetical protein TNCV_928881 [Trichonephila clavipes]|nr:hypothetical protein TNCV_928881 [Trichonephila clavipes]